MKWFCLIIAISIAFNFEEKVGCDADNVTDLLRTIEEKFNSLKPFSEFEIQRCEPEKFEHVYVLKNKTRIENINEWRAALPGQIATLRNLCLKANGESLTRRCLRKNGRAEWEPIGNGQRVICYGKNSTTSKLNEVLNDLIDYTENVENGTKNEITENKLIQNATQDMIQVLKDPKFQLTPTKIDIVTQINVKITEVKVDDTTLETLLSTYDVFHKAENHNLYISSKQYNSTNTLLKALEDSTQKLTGDELKSSIRTSPNKTDTNSSITLNYPSICARSVAEYVVNVFFINVDCANVSGIALYDSKIKNGPTHVDGTVGNCSFRFLYSNESIKELMAEPHLEAATFLPDNIIKEVRAKINNKTELWISVTVHIDDKMFIQEKTSFNRKPQSKIISISIPGFKGTFDTPLQFILRNNEYKKCSVKRVAPGSSCGFWNYSTWVSTGVATKNQNQHQQRLILCDTKHLTPFSYFTHGAYKQTSDGEIEDVSEHKTALDIISLVGCSLSLLGMLGVWTTAVISPAWRTTPKTKVLLNVCIALTLQMVLFICMNIPSLWQHFFDDEHACTKCICLGAILQYTTLVLFFWMLIVAYLQYKRFVQVFDVRPRHYILKSALAAWCFPLLPTLLVVYIDPDSYSANIWEFVSGDGMCYPSGNSLIFGVLLPISIICLVNLCIFVYIFYSLSANLNKSAATRDKDLIIKQVRLSILLFFLLGLSWIFGIITVFQIDIAFSYLFCLTATLQGFVIFLFFVVLDKQPRDAWRKIFRTSSAYRKHKKLSDTQTMLSASSVSYLTQKRNKTLFNNY